MRISIVLAALLLFVWVPGVASGQAIYKCVIKGKPTSYQDEPCSSNAKVASVRTYLPEAAPTPEQIQVTRHREALGRQESATLSTKAGTDRRGRGRGASAHVLPVGGSECADAKRGRDAWEKQVGLRRNYKSLQIWNDRIQRACR